MIFAVKPNTIPLYCVADTVQICFDDQVSAVTRHEMDEDAKDVIIAFRHQRERRTTLQGTISLLAEPSKDILPTAAAFKPH